MTPNALILNGETETSVGADQLTEWLKDLDRHGDTLIDAIRQGRAKVTTAAGFSEIAGRLREFARAYADEALRSSELTAQKTVLTNTFFYLLKSAEGIAHHAEDIAGLLALLPAGQSLDARSLLPLLMDGKKRDAIVHIIKVLGAAFEASWLTKIDVAALAPVLQDAGIDVSAYIRLAGALRSRIPSEITTENPETPHGEAEPKDL